MNWIIHFLISNIITLLCQRRHLNIKAACLLSLFAHIPIDVMDKGTYHPQWEEAWNDVFYNLWSGLMLLLSLFVLRRSLSFQKRIGRKHLYDAALVFGVAFDLWDWVLLRILAVITFSNFEDLYSVFGLHRLCQYVDVLKPVPSLRDSKYAVIIEVVLICYLWRCWQRLEKGIRPKRQSPNWSVITERGHSVWVEAESDDPELGEHFV